jgi:hypothetical protein
MEDSPTRPLTVNDSVPYRKLSSVAATPPRSCASLPGSVFLLILRTFRLARDPGQAGPSTADFPEADLWEVTDEAMVHWRTRGRLSTLCEHRCR